MPDASVLGEPDDNRQRERRRRLWDRLVRTLARATPRRRLSEQLQRRRQVLALVCEVGASA